MDKPQHLSEEDLLFVADGELVGRTDEAARNHLDACWTCRARLDRVQSTIRTVVTFRNEVLLPTVPEPPRDWQGLESRFVAADEQLARARSWSAVLRSVVSSVRQPRLVAAVALLILVAMLWPPAPALSAAELLARAETRLAVTSHRRVTLVVRARGSERVIASRRIDIWQDPGSHQKFRRVYDESQRLLAGEWTGPDGTRTIYTPGAPPRELVRTVGYELTIDDLWRLEPSAADFAALIPAGQSPDVLDEREGHTLGWASTAAHDGLAGVSLTLSEAMFHPRVQVLLVRRGGEVHEFRFTETDFSAIEARFIPRGAFRAEAGLLPLARSAVAVPPLERPGPRRIAAGELLDLEVEVLARLNGVGALLGEQLAVARDLRQGRVRVQGVVSTIARKQELLAALGPLALRREVALDLLTNADALARQAPASGTPPRVESFEVENTPIPVHDDLRRHITARLRRQSPTSSEPDAAAISEGIRRFAHDTLERSLQARLHARALRQAATRFSPADVQLLSPERRRLWHALIREHAEAFRQDAHALRRELQPIFFPDGPPEDLDGPLPPAAAPAGLEEAAVRLFELGSFLDAVVARALSLSVSDPPREPIDWKRYHRALSEAEHLAARVRDLAVHE